MKILTINLVIATLAAFIIAGFEARYGTAHVYLFAFATVSLSAITLIVIQVVQKIINFIKHK